MSTPVDISIDATNAATEYIADELIPQCDLITIRMCDVINAAASALDAAYVQRKDLVRCSRTARELKKEANELIERVDEYFMCLEILKRALVEELGGMRRRRSEKRRGKGRLKVRMKKRCKI
jgi:hypothetical protein